MDEGRGKARARTGATTWAPAIASAWRRNAPRWLHLIEPHLAAFATLFGRWAVADTAPGRLIVWLPIAFAVGVIVYFSAETEPAWWAGAILAAAAAAICYGVRARPVAFAAMLAATAGAAGFAAATIKTRLIAHPVIPAIVYNAQLSGFVELREERERRDRITIRLHQIDGRRMTVKPERVRVSVRKGRAPPVGTFVALRARLTPPLQPLRPGGYDFARDIYFRGVGATGFVLGSIRTLDPPKPPDYALRAAATISTIRDAIDKRIRSVISGDRGAIASALITGKRDTISGEVNDAMYVSGLAHVLSISGYHMAVVAGVVFFAIRALLALVPAFVARYPIKKWAAAAALAAATAYLLLSGAEIATQRAYIMTAIVLVGVMFDRPALTLRTIAVAAFVLLLVAPESLVHPSFQMSFAATLALIAFYERGLPWVSAAPDTRLAARVALWGGREILALIAASVVAGLATTLFAAYHFHRLAPYGVLANLLAMPIVSAWVMPSGLLALAAIPFGFDGPLWRLMGEGIGWMTAIAQRVADLPGSVGHIAAFGIGPLLAGTAGLVVICLLRSPLRYGGLALLVLSAIWAVQAPQPDIRVAPDGRMVAVRTASGQLSVMKSGHDSFVLRDWLAADGDARGERDETLAQGVTCDPQGCVVRRPDGEWVALSFSAEATAEDCARAAIVVSRRTGPPDCRAILIDRGALRASGAVTFWQNGKSYRREEVSPRGLQRPWAQHHEEKRTVPPSAQTRDATPRAEDLEPGD